MKDNKIGKILKVVGLITIILGIIGSLIAGNQFPILTASGTDLPMIEELYNWPLALVGSIASFVSGLLIIAFGENLQLLEANKFYLKKIQENSDKN